MTILASLHLVVIIWEVIPCSALSYVNAYHTLLGIYQKGTFGVV